LVTGSASFIRSTVAEALVRRREKVRIFDNFPNSNRHNLPHRILQNKRRFDRGFTGKFRGARLYRRRRVLRSIALNFFSSGSH
jgi:nucleoside-diphosphate-sugar epimerase